MGLFLGSVRTYAKMRREMNSLASEEEGETRKGYHGLSTRSLLLARLHLARNVRGDWTSGFKRWLMMMTMGGKSMVFQGDGADWEDGFLWEGKGRQGRGRRMSGLWWNG